MSDENFESSDGVDDVWEVEAPVHAVPAKKTFKKWHHPRKHWVRLNQLCKLSQKLFTETHFPDGLVRYLTLPGEELMDVQALQAVTDTQSESSLKTEASSNDNEAVSKIGTEELIDVHAIQGTLERVSTALQVKYLGFNNFKNDPERQATQEYAESILHDMDTIHGSSYIINGMVQGIANKSTTSYRDVHNHGPFNIINLDLCNSLATKKNASGNNHFAAIQAILDLQKRNTTQPFLMFIATRSEMSDIDAEAMGAIMAVYGENFKLSEDFRKKFEETVSEKAEELMQRIAKREGVAQDTLNKVFGVGVGKWLLHLMKPNPPAWDVTLEDVCAYSVGGPEGNMLSLAFKFTQVNVGIQDRTGLSPPNPAAPIIKTETDLALQMLTKAATIVDVDNLLETNELERNKIINQSGDLLTKVGYDKDEYIAWAKLFFSAQSATPEAV